MSARCFTKSIAESFEIWRVLLSTGRFDGQGDYRLPLANTSNAAAMTSVLPRRGAATVNITTLSDFPANQWCLTLCTTRLIENKAPHLTDQSHAIGCCGFLFQTDLRPLGRPKFVTCLPWWVGFTVRHPCCAKKRSILSLTTFGCVTGPMWPRSANSCVRTLGRACARSLATPSDKAGDRAFTTYSTGMSSVCKASSGVGCPNNALAQPLTLTMDTATGPWRAGGISPTP